MVEFLNILSIMASLVSLVMVSCLFFKSRDNEKREFIKADGTDIDDKRLQLEEDIYRANERLSNSSIGFDLYRNLYNENLHDICLTNHVIDGTFYENMGFDIPQMEVEKDFVTCLMPFHPSFDKIYNRIIRATKMADFHCHRSDEVYKSGDIMRYTIELILKSQIVIGVLDGRNPNVFYEVGIAHSIGKTVILIAEEKAKSQVPFDLQQHRFIFYKSLNDLEDKLLSALMFVRNNDR